ncbi:muscarinic acetylcholine receptor M2-like [Stegostoma tigrinum]|uniref:muscarinic acetylcholine receptor M2-like n=1 Tax=Stegostoma tigrinum TaxID=3053191 RepID=UPI00286FCC2A|nr:muscarinic acetylcholine receptor M2-like [Stegostoma tigrinum]
MDGWTANHFKFALEKVYRPLLAVIGVSVLITHQSERMSHSKEANEFLTNITNLLDAQRESSYETFDVIFIMIITGFINLMTIIGNILVIISIKMNRHLRTINNYFLFSLACADLILGLFTMNVFTIYTAFGYWPMGPVFCDLWLVVDYVVNNASGMNLLVISFDRYFCVTKPLSYPVMRTTKIAGIMIATAWVVPFLLWAPAIVFWQFIVGKRTVPEGECYPQLFSNPIITLVIVIAVFYLPVTIMVTLYMRISCASKSRMKWAKKISEPRKGFGSPSLWKAKMVKLNTNNTSNGSGVLPHAQTQSIKLTTEATIEKCGQQERNEIFIETDSLEFVSPNQKKEGETQESASFYTTRSQVIMDPVKLASMKIASKSQTSGSTPIIVGLAIDSSNMESDISEVRADDKINKMAKLPTNTVKVATHRDKTVTRTILAIILVFIITWTPYFVMVIIATFCPTCITRTIWNIGNWVVYVNSTINPACYALCNATFKKTFKSLLFCQYKNIGTTR